MINIEISNLKVSSEHQFWANGGDRFWVEDEKNDIFYLGLYSISKQKFLWRYEKAYRFYVRKIFNEFDVYDEEEEKQLFLNTEDGCVLSQWKDDDEFDGIYITKVSNGYMSSKGIVFDTVKEEFVLPEKEFFFKEKLGRIFHLYTEKEALCNERERTFFLNLKNGEELFSLENWNAIAANKDYFYVATTDYPQESIKSALRVYDWHFNLINELKLENGEVRAIGNYSYLLDGNKLIPSMMDYSLFVQFSPLPEETFFKEAMPYSYCIPSGNQRMIVVQLGGEVKKIHACDEQFNILGSHDFGRQYVLHKMNSCNSNRHFFWVAKNEKGPGEIIMAEVDEPSTVTSVPVEKEVDNSAYVIDYGRAHSFTLFVESLIGDEISDPFYSSEALASVLEEVEAYVYGPGLDEDTQGLLRFFGEEDDLEILEADEDGNLDEDSLRRLIQTHGHSALLVLEECDFLLKSLEKAYDSGLLKIPESVIQDLDYMVTQLKLAKTMGGKVYLCWE